MRWAELALFLVPFALYAAWRVAAATVRTALLWGAVAAALVVFAGSMIWLDMARRGAPGEIYVPAQIEGGRIVPGRAVPGR